MVTTSHAESHDALNAQPCSPHVSFCGLSGLFFQAMEVVARLKVNTESLCLSARMAR